MSHLIAISFAAAAIGISCIATDASARGGGRGGGGGHGGGGPMAAVSAKTYNGVNTNGVTKSYNSVNTKASGKLRRAEGVGGPNAGSPGASAGTPTGGGASMGAAYYAPASYNANTVCGRYPYPPCKKVLAR